MAYCRGIKYVYLYLSVFIMSKTNEMVQLADALDIVANHVNALRLSEETVPVGNSLGRIVSGDQLSKLDLPPFNKSAMDGYAIPHGPLSKEYKVLETVNAGSVPTKKLTPTTAMKIMTGAPVPEGTDRVIMVERTTESDGIMQILSDSPNTNFCIKGEDVRIGDTIVTDRTIIGPAEIANLISTGLTNVQVLRPIRIAIISTGDEIVDSPEKIIPGKIMNSNGPMLEALCTKHSLDVASVVNVSDKLEDTVQAIRDGLGIADIVVMSGGVSVGDFDYVAEAISQIGLNLHFNKLAVKPGKPMTFATIDQKVVLALPGNPVAVYLMFHLFVLQTARLMAGQKSMMNSIPLTLATDLKRKRADRMAFLPCKISNGKIKPVEYHGTAHLRALLGIDGFVTMAQGVTEIAAGSIVEFISFQGAC